MKLDKDVRQGSMKLSFDKEMDETLRRHARRAAESSAPAAPGGAHMDADEISAYAENFLPSATRLRYAAHLADCDHCRQLVVSVTLAANIAGELEKQAASPEPARASAAPAWRAWLAALFSARAVRYAIPALALVFVGALAFIVLRQAREPESANLVAERRDDAAHAPPGAPPPANEAAGIESSSPAVTSPTGTLAEGERAGRLAANQSTTERAATTTAAPPADEVDARRSEATSAGSGAQSVPQAAPAQPTVAPTPAQAADQMIVSELPPARPRENQPLQSAPAGAASSNTGVASASAPQSGGAARDRVATLSRDSSARNAPPAPPPPSVAANEVVAGPRATDTAGEERARQQGRSSSRRPVRQPSQQAQREEDIARSDPAETRSAGGRTFRRQGNAWVDTAYRPSLRTVNITRGSDQYRALVADEPALGRIIQQLGGEVIVVWGGRAYRVR